MSALEKIIKELARMLYGLFIGSFVNFIKLLKEFCEASKKKKLLKDRGEIYTRCQVIPSKFYKRPDPLIYSQEYLMAQGLGVTWDNPDIQLYTIHPITKARELSISSNDLKKNTEYLIEATVYNGSNEAAAVDMPVDFSFLSFGIGTTSTFIGTNRVDLPVRGAPNHPAHTSVIWHTPDREGHYCLQVRLNWDDDSNPKNNMGQENTNVGIAHSPAKFEFPVKNNSNVEERVSLTADSYTLQNPIDCNDVINGKVYLKNRQETKVTGAELCRLLAARHQKGDFPIPADWHVVISNEIFTLKPDEEHLILVMITPPKSFKGTRAFNINAFNKSGKLFGGVTLYVQQ